MSKVIPMLYLRLALILSGLFWAGHFTGFRESAAIISGTLPANELELFFGAFYVLCWFGFVLVAPILAIAGGMQLLVGRLTSGAAKREHTPRVKLGRQAELKAT